MLLINFIAELKLKQTNHCVLVSNGADKANANSNNIICTIKDTKLFVLFLTLSAKDNQKLSNLLSKRFERSVYLNEHKTKSEKKDMTNEYMYFLKSNFVGVNRLFVLIYLKRNND